MKTIEESVIISMDGSDKKLFPFLPYILQDIWEIGASPEVIFKLIRRHVKGSLNPKVLDLGCGKGAVSVRLAKEFGFSCVGIDAIKEFIKEANNKAREYKVEELCNFEVGDIRESIKDLKDFDIIILGAIGPVFGDYYSTLTTLSKCLDQNGIIIIDDSYIGDNSQYTHPLIKKRKEILQQINDSRMQLVDEVIFNKEELKNSDDYIFASLQKRCYELIEKYPDKSKLFKSYIEKQEKENDVLETKVVCSTMVIMKNKNGFLHLATI